MFQAPKSKMMLAGVLAASIVSAGCSADEKDAAGTATETPAVEEAKTTTYEIFRKFAAPEYPADGGEGKKTLLEAFEKTGAKGFDFKVTLASGDDYFTKLNLLATSGQLPDYFDTDAKTLARFSEEGLLLPLDEYLKDAPNLMKIIPEEFWKEVTFNGKIYGIPKGRNDKPFNLPSTLGLTIRQDWLDNLNLSQPTTLDELYAVMKAFVTQDPDKNGKDDTFGLGVSKETNFNAIFGAYGIIPKYWTEVDGGIKKGFVLPEMKEGLALLQKWYVEGLIAHDFPIMESKQRDELVINSLVGLFEGDVYYTEKSSSPLATALNEANPTANIVMLEAPKGPNGKQGYQEKLYNSEFSALSAKIKEPKKLFQYLDWIADQSDEGGFNHMMYGIENKDFTYDRATDTIELITPYAELYKKGYSNPVRFVNVTDRRSAKPEVREAIEIVNKHVINNALWKSVPAEMDYPDLETKLWMEYLVKIVTGVWPVEKYDEFIKKYYAQGGKLIEEQANELWKSLQ